MTIFNHKPKSSALVLEVKTKTKFQRYTLLVIGILIVALSYNVFFVPYKIVSFGISGLAIVINEVFNLNPSLFILVTSIILLIISYFTLGRKATANSMLGSLLFPLFVSLTAPISALIDLSGASVLVIAIFGGAVSGFGYGLLFKAGFTTGGTDILNQMTAKYFHISLGTSMLFIDGLIVILGGFIFGPNMFMYALIVLYIISIICVNN